MGRSIPRGAPVVGVPLGVMVLDTDIPRAVGDLNHGRSFPFPIQYEVADGASARQVVERNADGVLDLLVNAGVRLMHRGARALTSSCGFLVIFQDALRERLGIPVASSSLLQASLLLRVLPLDRRLCVVAANSATLSEPHLRGAGISTEDAARITVVGMQDASHFYSVVVAGEGELHPDVAEAEVLEVCASALDSEPSIGGFLFECTNLPPYSAVVREATNLPVWDSISLVHWLQAGYAEVANLA